MSTEPTIPDGDAPADPPRERTALHPDRDALADHAAQVLSEADAATVAEHVEACAQCRDDLAELESVRAMLCDDDPGPMPDDVWDRISAALAKEASARAGEGAHVDVPLPLEGPAPDQASDRAADRGAEVVPLAGLTVLRRPEPAGRRPGGAQARAGRRWWPALSAAAGIAVALGGLAFAVQAWTPDDGADQTATAGADMSLPEVGGGALPSVIRLSGQDYARATMQAQVRALLEGTAPAAREEKGGSADTQAEPRPTSPAMLDDSGARGPGNGGALRDPEVLRRCLTSLGVDASSVQAVDLARFEGREAALIVLAPAAQDTLEVYAVSRNCGVPDLDDGAFSFQRVAR